MTQGDAEHGLWGASAPRPVELLPLDGSVRTDIAIVGAGYTGLSTALHLAEAGERPLVLEARDPGWGASGRNTGWLEPNWWLKRPSDIFRLYGHERGVALTRWVASGPRLLQGWIERYGLQPSIEDRGLVMATDDADKAAAIASETGEWRDAGVDNSFLDGAAIEAHVPTTRYRGAMLLPDGLTLNPLALCRELARAAVAAGARLHAHSPVSAIERRGDGWVLRTARGVVTATRLVLATDAYTRRLWPELQRSYATWHAAVVASEPYEAIDELLPRGTAFADLGFANVFTLRRAGRRLVTSTFAPLRRDLSASDIAAPFSRKFARIFPKLPMPRWEFRHSGEIGLSRSMLPRLCEIGPDAWTAYGYSGTGMNLALLLGGRLADLARTGRQHDLAFPLSPLAPLPLGGAVTFGLRYVHGPLSRHVVSRFA